MRAVTACSFLTEQLMQRRPSQRLQRAGSTERASLSAMPRINPSVWGLAAGKTLHRGGERSFKRSCWKHPPHPGCSLLPPVRWRRAVGSHWNAGLRSAAVVLPCLFFFFSLSPSFLNQGEHVCCGFFLFRQRMRCWLRTEEMALEELMQRLNAVSRCTGRRSCWS